MPGTAPLRTLRDHVTAVPTRAIDAAMNCGGQIDYQFSQVVSYLVKVIFIGDSILSGQLKGFSHNVFINHRRV